MMRLVFLLFGQILAEMTATVSSATVILYDADSNKELGRIATEKIETGRRVEKQRLATQIKSENMFCSFQKNYDKEC